MGQIRIGQEVRFEGWADLEDHVETPSQGETGRVTDISKEGPSGELYEVIYRPGAPRERTFVHFRAEIEPTQEETQTNGSRRTNLVAVPVI